MADIRLAKPAAGATESIPSESGARFVFDFPATDATLERAGDDLAISFEDGSKITLENFYGEYNSDNLPSFAIDGEEVTAEDFFTAMNEPDLMPAAGPATAPTAADGARYHEYADMGLMGGIQHLEGLDWGMNRAFEWEEMPNSVGRDTEGAPLRTLSALETSNPLDPMRPVDVTRPPVDVQRPEQPDTPTPPIRPNNPLPSEPETPDVPPVTPETPNIPDTPDTPDNPDTPNIPDTPYNPDNPDTPNDVPAVDNPPRNPDDPDSPDNPGNPEDPDTPDNPDNPDEPTPPKDPEDPDHPDNPDNPSGDNFIPASGNSHVVVDEGAYVRAHGYGKGEHGGNHTAHGYVGSYKFDVTVPEDEGGVITLTGVDPNGNEIRYVCEVPVGANSELRFTAYDADGNELADVPPFYAGGVELDNFAITPVGGGKYTVTYDYELTKLQQHDVNHSSDRGHDGDSDYVSDNVVFRADGVGVHVVDGSGDEAQSAIKVEIHDDVPYVYVNPTDNGDGTVKNNSVVFDFGADDKKIDGVDYGDDIQKIELEIGGQKYEFDPDGGEQEFGDVVVSIDPDKGTLTFNYKDDTPDDGKTDIPIRVTVIDADGDSDATDLLLAPPKIHNDPKNPDDPDPDKPGNPDTPGPDDPDNPTDPEDPDKPADPENPDQPGGGNFQPSTGNAHVVVDEGALANGSGHHAWHGATGSTSFTVDIPAEEGGHITLSGTGPDGSTVIIDAVISANGQITNFNGGSFVSNGVELSGFTVEAAGEGSWKVSYDYRLTGNQTHDKADAPTEANSSFSSDNINFGANAVTIVVTDGTGDRVTSQINVEVHDDVPVIGQPQPVDTVLDSSATISFVLPEIVVGADADGARFVVEVDGQTYNFDLGSDAAGNMTFKPADGQAGLTISGNKADGYELTWQRPEEDVESANAEITRDSYEFKLTVIDGDQDVASTTVKVDTIGDFAITTDPDPSKDPDPDPTPEEPGKEPGDPIDMDGVADIVVTDESYLANGTQIPGANGDGESSQASSHGAFGILLNGQELTLTIGQGDNAVEIHLTADGNLNDPSEVAGKTIEGLYGQISDISVANGHVTYIYTQTKPFTHGDANNADEIADAENFNVALSNGETTKTGVIKVQIEDDAPTIANGGDLGSLSDAVESITFALPAIQVGADAAGARFVVEVDGQTYNFDLGSDAAGNMTFTPAAGQAGLTISGNKVDGYELTWQRPEEDVESANTKVTRDSYEFKLTVIDGDQDMASTTVKVDTIGDFAITTDPDPSKDPDPDPTPEEPGKEPGDPIDMDGVADIVVTDESYLANGTQIPGANGDGESSQAYSHGAFGILLNGQELTLTIGQGDNAVEIHLTADGNLNDPSEVAGKIIEGAYGQISDISVANGHVTYIYTQTKPFTHGDANNADDIADAENFNVTLSNGEAAKTGVIKVQIEDDAPIARDDIGGALGIVKGENGEKTEVTNLDGNVLVNDAVGADGLQSVTWSNAEDGVIHGKYGDLLLGEDGQWTYQLNTDSEAYKALKYADQDTESFNYTITDKDGDTSSATLTLNIGGNKPVTIEPEDPDPEVPGDPQYPDVPGASLTVREENLAAGSAPDDGSLTKSGKLAIDAPDGVESITLGHVTIDLNGAETLFPVEEGFLTVSYDKDSGNLNYSFTLNKNTLAHKGDNAKDIIYRDFELVVTDKDGDSASSTIRVNVVDDVPEITANESTGQISFSTQTTLDFSQYTKFTDGKDENHPDRDPLSLTQNTGKNGYSIIELNGIQCIASNVKYTYVDNQWIVDDIYDENGQGLGTGAWGHNNKHLSLDPDGAGLGVGNAWGNADMGLKGPGSDYSEAIVIEDSDKAVSYGMILEFGHFDKGDKALVTFMLTPRRNNDDSRVLVKEVTYDDLCDENGNFTGKYTFQVPDGYTKTFVSAMPNTDDAGNDVNSAFTIKKIEMTRPSYDHHGSVEIDGGADDVREGSFGFELDASQFANGVEVRGTLGNGDYKVNLIQNSDGSYTAKLEKIGAEVQDITLDGKTLFELKVNDDGSWDMRQFYNFSVKGTEDGTFNIDFKVADNDGDIATDKVNVNPKLEVELERFQNVEHGYYNETEWKWNAYKDNNADLMFGENGLNNLMYGRGGNDIMFGDGDAATVKGMLAALKLDQNLDVAADMQKIANDLAGKFDWKGNQVMKAINELRPHYQKDGGKALEDFVQAMEKLEKADGGDDALFGGLGNDILFGGAGDDYLSGNGQNKTDATKKYMDKDMLFGGSGNDIILYDADNADWVVHGGSGIDVLLVGSNMKQGLGELLGEHSDGAYVGGIEVMIKTEDTVHAENLGITSQDALKNMGIFITDKSIGITDDWKLSSDQVEGFVKYEQDIAGAGKVTIEIKKDDASYSINYGGDKEVNGRGEGDGATDGFTLGMLDSDGKMTVLEGDVTRNIEDTGNAMIFGDGADRQEELAEALGNEETFTHIMTMDGEENREFGDRLEAEVEGAGDDGDTIIGGSGNEVIFGMGGDDVIDGGEGRDAIFAGSGNDIIIYDENDVSINGGSGLDLLVVGKDDPSLEKLLAPADDAGDRPIVNNVEMLIRNENGNAKDLQIESMAGLAVYGIIVGNDQVLLDQTVWTPVAEQETGNGTTVTYTSNKGVTLEVTQAANQQVNMAQLGKDGADEMRGDAGDNIMHGLGGNDELFGKEGDDQLFGGDGVDILHGDEGNDYLDGGAGADWLYGGDGNDIIVYDNNDVLIDGGDKNIDFIIAAPDTETTLAEMLANGDQNNTETFGKNEDIPQVRDVEVLIKGDLDGIRAADELVTKNIGFTDTDDNKSLTLGSGWTQTASKPAEGDYKTETWEYVTEDGGKLTLETTLTVKQIDADLSLLPQGAQAELDENPDQRADGVTTEAAQASGLEKAEESQVEEEEAENQPVAKVEQPEEEAEEAETTDETTTVAEGEETEETPAADEESSAEEILETAEQEAEEELVAEETADDQEQAEAGLENEVQESLADNSGEQSDVSQNMAAADAETTVAAGDEDTAATPEAESAPAVEAAAAEAETVDEIAAAEEAVEPTAEVAAEEEAQPAVERSEEATETASVTEAEPLNDPAFVESNHFNDVDVNLQIAMHEMEHGQ